MATTPRTPDTPRTSDTPRTPWQQDACSLVDAFRKGELNPTEALGACIDAIEADRNRAGAGGAGAGGAGAGGAINAFSYLDIEAALEAAASADASLPFGGVPFGVKELDPVAGWPYTEASLVFADRVATYSATMIERLRAAGAVLVGQTTASEFGGVNCTSTRIHGTTGNPWNPERTPGGSSGGSAAAVAAGLVPIATGGDGGGSIRIPAGFTGLLGLKSTFGRIPKGPRTYQNPLTVCLGCLARSVADTARFFDVCNGFDPRDTLSLPRTSGWEAGLGSHRAALAGKRAVIAVDFGGAFVNPAVAAIVVTAAEALIADAKLERVDVGVSIPQGGFEWAMSNLVSLAADLGDLYPDCEELLTPEIQLGMNIATHHYDLAMAAANEEFRVELNEAMAGVFDQADFVFTATNPDVAFDAPGPLPTIVGGVDLVRELGFERAIANNGALTMPANLTGCPAISIPAGTLDGLPVGLQVMARHHEDQLLLELALLSERERPWPLVAPPAA